MKGDEKMTSVFDEPIMIDDRATAKKLMEIMMSDEPVEPLPHNPFFKEELKRGEELLKQCLLRSKR